MDYDLIVIGGGPGGYVAAITGAKNGLKTLLIEADQLGGTCLNRGCIPTKALLFCSEKYFEAKNSAELGVIADVQPFQYEKAFAHKEKTIKRLRAGVAFLVKQSGGTVLQGQAEILDSNKIRVGNETFGFGNLILATGAVPAPYPFEVGEGARLVNSDGFLALKEIPESCLVIGGGVIGLEFATILSRIGRKVVVLEAFDRILPTMDAELGKIVRKEMESQGIVFQTKTFVDRVFQNNNETVCEIHSGDQKSTLAVDLVICAVGRIANTEGLHPERVGLAMRKSFIDVDDRCATNVPHIYAIGDLNGYRMLAHAASYQGRKVAENIVRGTNRSILNAAVPACVYTDPELASVGLTEDEAKEKNLNVKIGRLEALGNGKMLSMGRKTGMAKILSNAATGEILGAQIATPHATDMIAELTLAMGLEATVNELAETIHPHPTISEMIMDAACQ
ncbi:MAG: dihydrolipoyl dehydrogenase [Planctomycetia bacterium]|nr:dihydrolipoyl dehydrogenase [Planctomycetia bacterium]